MILELFHPVIVEWEKTRWRLKVKNVNDTEEKVGEMRNVG